MATEQLWTLDPNGIDKDKWKCKFCEQPEGWFGNINLGLDYLSNDELRFQNQFGVDGASVALLFNGQLKRWSDAGNYVNLYAKNLARETALAGLEMGQLKNYHISLSFQQLQHLDREALSPFRQSSGNRLRLPLDWIDASNSQNMVLGDLQSFKIGTERKRLELDFSKAFDQEHWHTELNYQVEEKNGKQLFNGNFLTRVSQLPQSTDETHRQINANLSYQRDSWQLQLGYYGSVFANYNDNILWENPFTTLGVYGADTGMAATAPDNDFQQLTLSGYYHLPRTQIQGNLSIGKQSQDDSFLPYTTNPALNTLPLPATDADAKVDTMNGYFRILHRPTQRWRLSANYRIDDRDNQTHQFSFIPVSSDSLLSISTLQNTPYDFTSEKLDLESVWRKDRNVKLSLGYRRREDERNFQERKRTEEDKYWTELSLRYWRRGNLKLHLARSNRRGSEYRLLDVNSPQNSLMRKYYMADRQRLEWQLSYQHTPSAPWSAGFTLNSARDDYHNTILGVTEALDKGLELTASYQLTADGQLYFYSQWRWLESEQFGSGRFGQPDWQGSNEDEIHSAGLGISFDKLLEGKLKTRLDYTYSYSIGQTRTEPLRARAIDSFPNVTVIQHRIEGQASYQMAQNMDVKLVMNYQRYQDSDWHIDGIDVDSIYNLLGSGINSLDYNGLFTGASVDYRF